MPILFSPVDSEDGTQTPMLVRRALYQLSHLHSLLSSDLYLWHSQDVKTREAGSVPIPPDILFPAREVSVRMGPFGRPGTVRLALFAVCRKTEPAAHGTGPSPSPHRSHSHSHSYNLRKPRDKGASVWLAVAK